MRREGVNYLLVGCFVLGMFVLLLAALHRITGSSSDTTPYYVYYGNIIGIQEGSKVTIGGYQIGVVDEISPHRQGMTTQFKLQLALDKEWEIPQDSIARIIMPAVLSDNQIDIVAGRSTEYLKPGDTLIGQESVGIMAAMDSMAVEIKNLSTNNIKPFVNALEEQISTIGGDLQENIPLITGKLNLLLQELTESAENFKVLVGADNQKLITDVFTNAEKMTNNLAEVSGKFANAQTLVDQLLQDTNRLITDNNDDIRQSVMEFHKTLETLSQHINSIVYNLEGTSRNMNEFSREIRENPSLLIGNRNVHPDDGEPK